MYKDIKRELNFLRVVSKIVKFLSAGFKTNRQQRLLSRIPERIACKDPPHSDWAENIIFAGSTAFLLLIVNIFPAYWYFSFFALTPFLYKTIKSTPEDSSRLGFLLGFLFFSVSLSESLVLSPLTASIKLISGTALIAIFGWTVGWTRKRWGFNPLVIALLWVGFELGLVKFGFDFGLFGKTTFTHSLFGSVILLIGFITISFVIVLSNSLLVLLFEKSVDAIKSRDITILGNQRIWPDHYSSISLINKTYLMPETRAPPVHPKTNYILGQIIKY